MSDTKDRFQSDFARRYYAAGEAEGEAKGKAEGKAEGKAQAKAQAVIAVLEARGFAISDTAYEKIIDCSDLEQLDKWIRLAATTDRIGDMGGTLFG